MEKKSGKQEIMPLSGLRRSLKRAGLYGIDCSRTDTKEQTESTDIIGTA